jgi:hypothetical protein
MIGRWMCVAGVGLSLSVVACGKNSDSGAAATPSAAPSAKPAAAATSAAKPAAAAPSASAAHKPKPAPKPQHNALDEKPKAPPPATAEWLTIPGTNGTFAVPKTWKHKTEGEWVVSGAADDSSGFVATTYKPGEDPTGKLGKLAQALEFTDCEWGALSDVTIGKDEFPAKMAEGLCLQKEVWNYVQYFLVPGAGLNVFVLAGFDETAKDAQIQELEDILRSIKKK